MVGVPQAIWAEEDDKILLPAPQQHSYS